MSLGLGDQYLEVAAVLDPTRARAPPETDTNDLKTIDVYAVSRFLIPPLRVPTPWFPN